MNLTDLGYKGKKLEKLYSDNICSVPELLYREPRKYLYFNRVTELALSKEVLEAARNKTPIVFKGKLKEIKLDEVNGSKITVIKIKILNEDNNQMLYVNIFGAYRDFECYELMKDKDVYVGGRVEYKDLNGFKLLSISNPDLLTMFATDLKIYPVYRKYKGISEEYYKSSIRTSFDGADEEYLPCNLASRFHLLSYKDTIKAIHFPEDEDQITEAKKRIVFDQMLYFASKVVNSNTRNMTTDICPISDDILNGFIKSLPYELTDDQKNAIDTLKEKMRNSQTSALIQGDVSCGKTIVAMALMILMAQNGYQSVLMAPTVILARQHYEELLGYANKLGFSVAFLSSETTQSQKKKLIKEISEGKHQLIVGTHSVFSKNVIYSNLGLVITDEEHKFGVLQRESIRSKTDVGVHLITMSATPIPRTLACSIYGDNIEVITIKQMPNGRKPIQTAICTSDRPVFSFVEKELRAGHQTYVVCPLIEEADEESTMSGISSTEEVATKYKNYFERLGFNIGIITSKTSSEDQKSIKKMFTENKIQILVATTVIEVGINVPNASVIVITSAERFGLATLHQLRGRVGRGSVQSYCILQKTSSEIESDNLEILTKETDGLEIAKADLKNRGSGNILGVEQSGNNKFIDLIIAYPNLYERVKQIADVLSKDVRTKYIETYEEMYPSCM